MVELILVMALVALVLIPTTLGVTNYRQKQALYASSDILSSVLMRAHIYSREAKGQKLWGVRQKDSASYELISGFPGSVMVEAEFGLTSPTLFSGDSFEVWFFVDTGEADFGETIRLITPKGKVVQVVVNKSGSVDIL